MKSNRIDTETQFSCSVIDITYNSKVLAIPTREERKTRESLFNLYDSSNSKGLKTPSSFPKMQASGLGISIEEKNKRALVLLNDPYLF